MNYITPLIWKVFVLVQVATLITAIPVEDVTGPPSKSLLEPLRENLNGLRVQLSEFWPAPNSGSVPLNNRAENHVAQYLSSPSEPSHQHCICSDSGSPVPGTCNTCSCPIQKIDPDHAEDEQEEKCVICLENFEENQDILKPFGQCLHQFHKDCIQPWTNSHSTCPICIKENPNLDSYLLAPLRLLISRFFWHQVRLRRLTAQPALRPKAEHHFRLTKKLTWPHELPVLLDDHSHLPPADQLTCLEIQVWQHADWMDFLMQVAFHPEAEIADLKELASHQQYMLSRSELLDLRPEAQFASMEQLASRHQELLSHLERPARIQRLEQLRDTHEIWLMQLERYYRRVQHLSSTAG